MHQWNPKQYQKFIRERQEPFYDLIELIHPIPKPKILDLGCGDGILTKYFHEKCNASYTLGIDSSKEMLHSSFSQQSQGLHFQEADISTFSSTNTFNYIISNAALQWVPDHKKIFKQIAKLLAPNGQIAFQMPASWDYPTHTIAAQLSMEDPYKEFFKEPLKIHVLTMEKYAQMLEDLGFDNQIVRIQLYAYYLESTATVLEWVEGGLLTYYRGILSEELYAEFHKEYKNRLFAELKWSEPFFFPMKRLFLWAQLP